MTITIKHAELNRLVTVASKCVGTDPYLPVFEQVRLRSRNGLVEAMATDRFAIAWVRGESEFPADVEFGLKLADWKHLLGLYRPARRSDVTLNLDVTDDKLTVSRSEGILFGPADVTASYPLVKGASPKLDHLLPDLSKTDARSSDPLPMSPKQLAKLPADREAVFVPGLPGKPSWIVGDDYCICLMGLRVDAALVAERVSAWTVKAETEGAAA